jgi:Protein of unknown function with PCYCGC motif
MLKTKTLMISASKLSILLLGAALILAPMARAADQPAPTTYPPSEARAAADLRNTLDPMQFTGEVREAYKIARENPDLLIQLHCYCGCDQIDGHKNLLDCYRSAHAASCAICTGEVIEAKKLYDQGASIETIRGALRARFAGKVSN